MSEIFWIKAGLFIFQFPFTHNFIIFLFLREPYRKWQKNNPSLALQHSYFGFARGVGEFWLPERKINRTRALLAQTTSLAVNTAIILTLFIVWRT